MARRGDGRRCGGNYIVTSYSSPVPAGKENLGGDDDAAGDVARETVDRAEVPPPPAVGSPTNNDAAIAQALASAS